MKYFFPKTEKGIFFVAKSHNFYKQNSGHVITDWLKQKILLHKEKWTKKWKLDMILNDWSTFSITFITFF